MDVYTLALINFRVLTENYYRLNWRKDDKYGVSIVVNDMESLQVVNIAVFLNTREQKLFLILLWMFIPWR